MNQPHVASDWCIGRDDIEKPLCLPPRFIKDFSCVLQTLKRNNVVTDAVKFPL